jgi:predicted component of type VI protein secretion system
MVKPEEKLARETQQALRDLLTYLGPPQDEEEKRLYEAAEAALASEKERGRNS